MLCLKSRVTRPSTQRASSTWRISRLGCGMSDCNVRRVQDDFQSVLPLRPRARNRRQSLHLLLIRSPLLHGQTSFALHLRLPARLFQSSPKSLPSQARNHMLRPKSTPSSIMDLSHSIGGHLPAPNCHRCPRWHLNRRASVFRQRPLVKYRSKCRVCLIIMQQITIMFKALLVDIILPTDLLIHMAAKDR